MCPHTPAHGPRALLPASLPSALSSTRLPRTPCCPQACPAPCLPHAFLEHPVARKPAHSVSVSSLLRPLSSPVRPHEVNGPCFATPPSPCGGRCCIAVWWTRWWRGVWTLFVTYIYTMRRTGGQSGRARERALGCRCQGPPAGSSEAAQSAAQSTQPAPPPGVGRHLVKSVARAPRARVAGHDSDTVPCWGGRSPDAEGEVGLSRPVSREEETEISNQKYGG